MTGQEELRGSTKNELSFKMHKSFKATLVSGLIGIGAWVVKEYTPALIKAIKDNIHKQLVIDQDKDRELFNKVETWLLKQKRINCSSFTVGHFAEENKVTITSGFTTAMYKINNKICMVERNRNENKHGYGSQTICITILYSRKEEDVKHILDEINGTVIRAKQDMLEVSCGWCSFFKNKRSLDTIAIPMKDKDLIVNDLTRFMQNKKSYIDRGITYKRNYMFYGEPGCGKSSFIWALASKFGKNLKIVDISTVRSANDLQSILAYNTKSFIIFEDIDAMGADVNARDTGEAKQPISDGACEAAPEPAKPISMSSLLNVFDGLNTPDGAICFFTTNHIDRLDPALVRDGRIDVKLKIGKVQGTELINNIASNLLDEADLRIFKERLRDDILITPATVQCLLMDYPIDVAIDKINNHGEL